MSTTGQRNGQKAQDSSSLKATRPERFFLIAAAACDGAIAVLHVYIISQGAWAYRWFGAGEAMATMAQEGSWIPALITSGIVVAALVAAAYYLSAAGLLPKPPLLRLGLFAVAAVYTLRGAFLFPALLIIRPISPFDVWTSLISLTIGLIHLAGAGLYWRRSRNRAR